MRIRPLPSTGLLIALLLAVILLALRFNPAPHRHHSNHIPGLTFEARKNGRRGPVILVVTSVQDRGPAAGAHIAAGDVIDRIDGRPIPSLAAVGAAVRRDRGKTMLLHLRHAGESGYKRLPASRH